MGAKPSVHVHEFRGDCRAGTVSPGNRASMWLRLSGAVPRETQYPAVLSRVCGGAVVPSQLLYVRAPRCSLPAIQCNAELLRDLFVSCEGKVGISLELRVFSTLLLLVFAAPDVWCARRQPVVLGPAKPQRKRTVSVVVCMGAAAWRSVLPAAVPLV